MLLYAGKDPQVTQKDENEMNKPYIICLQYGTWHNELWFSAPDNEMTARNWQTAVDLLPDVSERCTNSNQFMSEAVEHFSQYGFTRIQH